MSINGIGTGYLAWRETGNAQKNSSGTGFANKMAGADMAGSVPSQRTSVRTAGQNSALDAYRASAVSAVRNVKPAYETYESENYRIVQDGETGKQFLISRHGVMSYVPLELDDELKEALQKVVGVDTLETEDGLGNVSDEKKTENKTDIIVKPDGSRVLVVTMSVGGMETTMSIEISKPTNMQNDNLKHDNDNGGIPVSESETISNDISDSVSEA